MAMKKTTLAMRAEQTTNADGSITIRPVAMADGRDIRSGKAAEMLGVCRETIYLLCELGEENGGLRAWKLPSARGNSPWRISLASVLEYRGNRIKAERSR